MNNIEIPPQNLEAEQSVLGAVLLENSALSKCIGIITPDDFYRDSHRKIYTAMLDLFDRSEVIDLVTLTEHLTRKNDLEAVGGASYLASIASQVPTAANVKYHSKIVREKALRRKIWLAAQWALEKADSADLDRLKDTLNIDISGLEGHVDTASFLKTGLVLQALNIVVEWIIKGLIPLQSITLLHGRGGIGKSWLALLIAYAVSLGKKFMGIDSKKMPVVFIDFENSLPVLVDRIRRIGIEDVYFWHSSEDIKPPRLDGENWINYKYLPEGALIIFDTLRASQGSDENDSRQMAFIMQRLKELRDMGYTILLLHHTPKGNDRTYKGSTAILDLADHVLSLHKVRKGNPETEADDDEDTDCYSKLGTKDKTRYEPFHIFLDFDPERGFVEAPDPDLETVATLSDIICDLAESLGPPIQTQVIDKAKEALGISGHKIRRLLKKGDGEYWTSTRMPERKNAIVYQPIIQGGNSDNQAQSIDSAEFASLPDTPEKTEKEVYEEVF